MTDWSSHEQMNDWSSGECTAPRDLVRKPPQLDGAAWCVLAVRVGKRGYPQHLLGTMTVAYDPPVTRQIGSQDFEIPGRWVTTRTTLLESMHLHELRALSARLHGEEAT